MTNKNTIKSLASPPIFEESLDRTTNQSMTRVSMRSSHNVFFNTCFDKNHLKTVIAWFLEQYGEKATVDLVETLKQVGFHQATRAGVSLGVDDLKVPPQKNTQLSQASVNLNDVTNAMLRGNLTSVEKSQRLIDTWNQTSENLRQTAVQNFRATNPVNPVYMMAFSGARGNISQVRQLVAMRGLMADPQGAILEFPIQSNFREGLTVTEYLLSCYGARKGLVDTALRTATSGYLTRRLVDAVQHVVVHVKDCHTKKGLVIKGKNLEKRLIGRVLFKNIELNPTTTLKKNTLISHRLAKQIASQYTEIFVRSPLTCQTEKSVCQLCYGLDLAQGKLVSIGESVGIIAAQSIGEPGTQLTMRTFHTGGVGVFSEQAMKSFSAPFTGRVEFLEPLSGLFVRTPHGNIVYLLKHKIVTEKKPILRLTSLESAQKPSVYEIMHSDVPAGSLLWVKQGELVKSGQLLVQASRLQTPTQEMPESSHPVRASLSGEVFFEKMAIRVIEEEKRGGSKTKKKISKQEEKKEISPKFPTLIELGNFWVFSAFVQKEEKFCNSFFVKGDLLSPETPIQQYNLYFLNTGQVKKLNSSIVFGHTSLKFRVSKIQYSGLFYFLQEKEKNKENFLVYTSNSKETLFTWYPSFSTQHNNTPFGYCSVIEFESDFCKRITTPKPEVTKYRNVSFAWSSHKIFRLNSNLLDFEQKKLTRSCCFLVSQTSKSFAKTGIFQFKKYTRVNWTLKNHFTANFIKNLSQKGTQKVVTIIHSSSNLEFLGRNSVNFGNTVSEIQNIWGSGKTRLIKKGLDFSHKTLISNFSPKVVEKQKLWVSIPETSVKESVSSQLSGILLEPGKKFENLCFNHSYVSTNLIHTKNIVFLKSKISAPVFSYSLGDILGTKKEFLQTEIKSVSEKRVKLSNFTRHLNKTFYFYKQQGFFNSRKFVFTTKRKRRLSHVLFFQQNSYQILPTTQVLKQKILFSNRSDFSTSFISVKSPLFTKQSKTSYSVQNEVDTSPNFTNFIKATENKQNLKPSFKVLSPTHSGWFSFSSFLKIQLKVNTPNSFNKVEQFKQNFVSISDFPKLYSPGFNLFFYQKVKLNNSNEFKFQTFTDGWVLPEFKLTEAFLMAKKLGEFRIAQEKQNQKQTSFSLLRAQDQTNVNLPSEQTPNQESSQKMKVSGPVHVGAKVRWGQELVQGFAIPVSGQIIKTTSKTATLQKGLPILASIRGLVHISHQDLIEKNDLLITLRSRRLQTEDIVQGIPKIEQLFEARETQGGEKIKNSMHDLLEQFFKRARQVRPFEEAVDISFLYIQKFLVDNILEAYSNQGVTIAEKHVEVVVRQMTARVRITTGGDTGFLPGEFVQRRWIEQVNLKLAQTGRRVAKYEPVILGITKSVLQSESFLLAASFQQVSKVLVKSALAKKTDFLRGLHENLLVGQPIPAGTGIIQHTKSDHQSVEISEISESLPVN